MSTPSILRYGPLAEQFAELSLPAGPAEAPLILLFHGGFWREAYDLDHIRPLAAALTGAGYAVANVEYRRVGGAGGWPNTVLDAAAACDDVPMLVDAQHSERVRLDAVVTMGHSAGGHLALWSAVRDLLPPGTPGWRPTPPRLAGVLSLAGVVDLGEADRLGEGNGAVAAFLGGNPAERAERLALADPARVGPPAVPVELIHGDRDEVLDIGISRRCAASSGARLTELPGISHFDLIDPESSAFPFLLASLDRVLHPEAT